MEDFRQSGGTIVMVTHDETLVQLFATQEWHVKDGALFFLVKGGSLKVYSLHDTFLTSINPTVKLLCLLALFFVIVLIHNPNVLLFMVVCALLVTVFFSGHPKRYVLLYVASFVLLFVSASTTMIFFGQGETTWVKWGLLHITEESFYTGLHLGLRATLFATLGLLFLLTTKPVLLFYSLMQQLKLPPTFAYAFFSGSANAADYGRRVPNASPCLSN